MDKTGFLFWLLVSPVIAASMAWLIERLNAATIREWIAAPFSNSDPPPR